MQRRQFMQSTAVGGIAMAGIISQTASGQENTSANEKINVAVAGVRGRGNALLQAFARSPDVQVKYVCDIDEGVRNSRAEGVGKQTGTKPSAIKDFREALDDDAVDALVLGTPDHWHAIPTILACQAGKDVYVEKPDGHNVIEGRTMVAAMKKHNRIVQLGTQARSRPYVHHALAYVREGKIGRARFAKAWESARQGSIGHPSDGDPPAGVDYDMWLGAAPKRPFNPRRFHGSWRWFFDYGTGDLGNDGVHRLDVARWALESALASEGKKLPAVPQAVSSHGGKHYFDDDQEWPDNLMVTYDFGDCLLTYEMRIWTPHRMFDETEGSLVYGDNGYVILGNSGWRAYDAKGKQISSEGGGDSTSEHVRNFLDCMRSRKKPNADLETVGHPSSLLCHLGNAAWRAGRTLKFDAENYQFIDDEPANQLLTRPEYRKPWVLPNV